MRATRLMAVIVAVLTSSCAPLAPIQLTGETTDVSRLVGHWRGYYTDGRMGRAGSIDFSLEAGEDYAHGDVEMRPPGAERGYSPYPGRPIDEPHARVLTIRFVSTTGHMVTGALDEYWDPDAQCRAFTTFKGRVDGDTMRGTFTTTCQDGQRPVTGRWRVTRGESGIS